jgi:hypothetical protein
MTKRIGCEPRGAGRVSGAVHKVSASPNALTGLSSVDDAGTQAWSLSRRASNTSDVQLFATD